MEKKNKLNVKGVMSEGYGIIPKKVMKDKDLTIDAKAIYAFMASFAGAGNTSFPSVNLITDMLGISRQRFNKHRKLLEDKGYITIKKERKSDGSWESNVYTLETLPRLQNPTLDNLTLDNPTSGNVTTNNNTINNNTINNNTKSTSRSKLKFETHHLRLAELLYKQIQSNLPNFKEPNLEMWANEFRLIMERDKREGEEIQDLIIKSQSDDFWKKNILSPSKLRKQYDRLVIEFEGKNNFKPGNNIKSGDNVFDYLEEL